MNNPSQGAPAPIVRLSHNVELPLISYRDQPVITLAMMDKAHRRPDGTARRNFNTNKDKLIEGEDYFQVCADEIRTHKIMPLSSRAHEAIVLLTETGYLMLVKSFTDDLAWQVQRELVKNYFRKTGRYETPAKNSDIRVHHSSARIDIELHPDSSGDIHYIGLTASNAAEMLRIAAHALLKVAGVNCGEEAVS